jgi:hypothetical protein
VKRTQQALSRNAAGARELAKEVERRIKAAVQGFTLKSGASGFIFVRASVVSRGLRLPPQASAASVSKLVRAPIVFPRLS